MIKLNNVELTIRWKMKEGKRVLSSSLTAEDKSGKVGYVNMPVFVIKDSQEDVDTFLNKLTDVLHCNWAIITIDGWLSAGLNKDGNAYPLIRLKSIRMDEKQMELMKKIIERQKSYRQKVDNKFPF